MSHLIYLNAEFSSYADFKSAFDEYCQENAIANIPLAFSKQTVKKLTANTFTDELPLNQQIIDRIVYKSLALVCSHHISKSSKKIGSFCEGRITLRFIPLKNVLRVTSFIAQHSNHPSMNNNSHGAENLPSQRNGQLSHITSFVAQHHANHPSMDNSNGAGNLPNERNDQLNRILALVRKMPDDGALDLVEETCQSILKTWDAANYGLDVHLVDASPNIKQEPQMLSGK